jgi:hypothetical protein
MATMNSESAKLIGEPSQTEHRPANRRNASLIEAA